MSLVPLDCILSLCHPFENNPWLGGKVTEAMVRRHLRKNLLQSMPVMMDASSYLQAGRIAFLAKHGWNDPIQIDVGVPALGCCVDWLVVDGNHRVAAAYIRGDSMIRPTETVVLLLRHPVRTELTVVEPVKTEILEAHTGSMGWLR